MKEEDQKKDESVFLSEWISDVRTCDKAIIVEGTSDKRALAFFEIKNIFTLRRPLYLVCEEIAYKFKDAIILTDFDRKGKELYGKLNHELSQLGVRIDRRFREELFKETKLSQIEGLIRYWKRCSINKEL